jgi:hypothetical protein
MGGETVAAANGLFIAIIIVREIGAGRDIPGQTNGRKTA